MVNKKKGPTWKGIHFVEGTYIVVGVPVLMYTSKSYDAVTGKVTEFRADRSYRSYK